ncbi:hypothetical protein Aduo_003659 [Ancylostoma duodenale]
MNFSQLKSFYDTQMSIPWNLARLPYLSPGKVCVHCKCDKSEHELPPNQAGSVYERLGIKPPANMPISSSRDDAPGSVSHGYAWVPPGLTRKKVC